MFLRSTCSITHKPTFRIACQCATSNRVTRCKLIVLTAVDVSHIYKCMCVMHKHVCVCQSTLSMSPWRRRRRRRQRSVEAARATKRPHVCIAFASVRAGIIRRQAIANAKRNELVWSRVQRKTPTRMKERKEFVEYKYGVQHSNRC